MLRLKRHGEVGDDNEGLRERGVVNQRNVRQVDSRFGLSTPVGVNRDVAHRLERFVGQRMLLARDWIELWVAGEPRFERSVEIGTPEALQLVVQFNRNTAGLDASA